MSGTRVGKWLFAFMKRTLPHHLLAYRVLPLAYGALLLGLALYKATEFWKQHGLRGSLLVFVLVKDQAIYFTLWVSNPSSIHTAANAISVVQFVVRSSTSFSRSSCYSLRRPALRAPSSRHSAAARSSASLAAVFYST